MAVEAFWRAVQSRTTPLVDPIPGDPDHVLATFLWRDADASTTDVVLQARLNGTEPYHDPRSHLRRLAGTDVWYASFRLPRDAEFIYQFAINPPAAALVTPTTAVLRALLRTDPLNPHRYPEPPPGVSPRSLSQSVSIATMPDTPPNPWLQPGATRRGEVREHSVQSAILNGSRTVWVYRPPVEQLGEVRVLLLFDGQVYLNRIPTATVLDNLLAARRIPPTLALLIDNGGPGARTRDLTFSDAYLRFLTDELLPWAQREYHFTAVASRTVVGGSSLGGLTAAYAGLRRPDVFGAVLSQSGSFNEPRPGEENDREEWIVRQFEKAPRTDVRFCIEVGQIELETGLLPSNQHLRDVLTVKGVRLHYFEVFGAHEPVHWRRTLPESLIATLS